MNSKLAERAESGVHCTSDFLSYLTKLFGLASGRES